MWFAVLCCAHIRTVSEWRCASYAINILLEPEHIKPLGSQCEENSTTIGQYRGVRRAIEPSRMGGACLKDPEHCVKSRNPKVPTVHVRSLLRKCLDRQAAAN